MIALVGPNGVRRLLLMPFKCQETESQMHKSSFAEGRIRNCYYLNSENANSKLLTKKNAGDHVDPLENTPKQLQHNIWIHTNLNVAVCF